MATVFRDAAPRIVTARRAITTRALQPWNLR
jgi:hypothetical protein